MAPSYKVFTSTESSMRSLDHQPSHNRTLIDSDCSISSFLPFVSSTFNSCDLRNESLDYNYSTDSNYILGFPLSNVLSISNRGSFDSLLVTSVIDKLPFEIRLKIACYLNQYDAYNLMRVNKSFFESTVSRLYHTVVIDPDYSPFNQDINQSGLKNRCQSISAITFIKMGYSLKCFFNTINQSLPIDDYHTQSQCSISYGLLISKIHFVEVPDGFNCPFDLKFFIYNSILKLENLNKFIWDSSEALPYGIIDSLPNKDRVSSLFVNLSLKKNITSKDYESFKHFKNLESLSLEPFINSCNLFQIFKSLLEGNEGAPDKLKSLRIARYNSNNNFLKSIPSSALVLTDYILELENIQLSEYDMNCILNLFILFNSYDTELMKLETFALDSIVISTLDAKRLGSFINLSILTHLELRNMTEVQFPEDIQSAMSMKDLSLRLDQGFLKSLGRKLKSLKRLSIDYREGLRDTVPSFIHMLDNLEELDVTIRWNITKLCTHESWKHLCFRYVKAILKHSKTLKKLSLDTKEDSVFCDLHKLIFTEYLLELRDMKNLMSLRLHGYSLQGCAPMLVSHLPSLEFMELFGSGAGGTPHMGLQVVHEGVLDDALRVQHVAEAISKSNGHVKFIKIDKCIFEVKENGKILPRDGLGGWFGRNVRVEMDRV
ncbi:hypothetical protein BN7_5987 [Wickerhamomyces ciferrii]|uniref:F-box domain-containing protein n=1 Tax=Wickerhamomyces ciferrii (strain ATCC 14091 / BCRC 22168 / CBS 111 / JCM 3599 / NBRC 0793 / NRRL Y-1031 F-60-10) TaxID=1206466 RepID=K0KY64_WICCF|nr:uncharacterized protein BN7_5987 [Wickerhamomyces ciferrii]CCH46394.1 hypothetical protein BN7_5987 [Wickerhamomyces ciferrii]